MSVFHDFQKAWGAKFPGCDLPQAWEEDVRANLAKHRHKVAVLKEDLEKEEFYVEYLERLLADVETHKQQVTKDKCKHSGEIGQNGDTKHEKKATVREEVEKEELLLEEEELVEAVSPSLQETKLTDLQDLPDLGDPPPSTPSEVTAGDSPVQVAAAAGTTPNGSNKGSPYVTVIRVNGFNSEDTERKTTPSYSPLSIDDLYTTSTDSSPDASLKSQKKSSTSSSLSSNGSTKSKVPPKPPPKRPRRSPSSNSITSVTSSTATDGLLTPLDGTAEVSANGDAKLPLEGNSNGIGGLPSSSAVSSLTNSQTSSLHEEGSIDRRLPKVNASSIAEFPMGNMCGEPNHEESTDSKMELTSDSINDEGIGTSASDHDSLLYPAASSSDYDDPHGTMKSQASGQSGYSSGAISSSDGALSTCSPIPPSEADSSTLNSSNSKYSDYVNIDYFLRRKARHHPSGNEDDSDDDDDDGRLGLLGTLNSDADDDSDKAGNGEQPGESSSHPRSMQADYVFEVDSGVYSSSVESTSYVQPTASSTPPLPAKKLRTPTSTPQECLDPQASKMEAERIAMYRCVISSILESETVYLECLTVLLQYMKALRSTIGTSQPVMNQEDFNVIFFKIPELQSLHGGFLEGIRNRTHNWDGKLTIGDHFKILASKLGIYASFLQNYPRAIETVRKCSTENVQFSEITKSIKLKTLKGQAMSLEDLLHKPVARVQKNAFVLHDLLKYTPKSHPDHVTLKTALKLTQCFLNEFNSTAAGNLFPVQDRVQRHLVKNSFIVELSEGHRKLRHLFLFNDVIVCAKYKVSGREKFTFEVKWYMPLAEIVLPQEEEFPMHEVSPANILALKTQASTVRDQILKEEKINMNRERHRPTGRVADKQRKKLAELEGQLVLAAPNLPFRIAHKHGKMYAFFLSSDFERTQWIEAINTLQATAPAVSPSLNLAELQTWITACRTFLKTNMGSFLMRSPARGSDEVLVGDLHVVIHSLQGLSRPADIFLSLEVDSYGHFFCKARTKVCKNTTEPVWNQDFVVELEGSQSLRLLCYEQHPQQGVILRAKTTLELNRQWLTGKVQEKTVTLQEFLLALSIRFVPGEMTMRRAPSAKPCGLFGVKISQVCKKEKRPIPFVITSCAREVERRGMSEVGVYRVSGSTSDMLRLKKAFETNAYEAEQLLKEVDVHSVTGLLKMYLRELPEALFTDELYPKFFEAFSMHETESKKNKLLVLFNSLPDVNRSIIMFLIDHMVKLNKQEVHNKMTLHNLATVYGPTLLRPGTKSDVSSPSDLLAAETIDVMAQAGILYFFLKRRSLGEQIPHHNPVTTNGTNN